jgi:hypothetical protein
MQRLSVLNSLFDCSFYQIMRMIDPGEYFLSGTEPFTFDRVFKTN